MDNKTLFEIKLGIGDSFKANAEMYTPDGNFINCLDSLKPNSINTDGNAISIGGMTISGHLFQGCKIGIWLREKQFFSDRCKQIEFTSGKVQLLTTYPKRNTGQYVMIQFCIKNIPNGFK